MSNQSKGMKTLLLAAVLCLLAVFAAAAVAEGELFVDGGTVSMAETGWSEMDAEAEWEQCYIEVSREGVVETKPVETLRVINFDTTIAMDPDYFTYQVRDGIDTFVYDAWQGEREVYYSVYAVEGSSPNEICEALAESYGDAYAGMNVFAYKVGDYNATAVQFDGENGCPSYQLHFFIIPAVNGCVVIEAQFDFEMYEGLYRIMLALFDTLRIW